MASAILPPRLRAPFLSENAPREKISSHRKMSQIYRAVNDLRGFADAMTGQQCSSTEASVRQDVTAGSAVPVTGPARLSASRFVSRSTAAYRLVVSTLACPSQWLISGTSDSIRARQGSTVENEAEGEYSFGYTRPRLRPNYAEFGGKRRGWIQRPSSVLSRGRWKSKSTNFLGKWLAILDGFATGRSNCQATETIRGSSPNRVPRLLCDRCLRRNLSRGPVRPGGIHGSARA
jgi:hypothetical protein